MDYNDLSSRLEKTLNSLNGRFNDEIAVYVTHDQKEEINPDKTKTTTYSFSYTFGKDDQETIVNKIFIILYNLSSIKDNLKNIFKSKGINPKQVEDEINNSIHLQVLIDIVNQEKHGYPLKQTNRSNKNPLIIDACESIQISVSTSPEKKSAESRMFFTPNGLKFDGDGTQRMAIVAKIVDGDKNELFTLDELVNTSYEKFLSLAKRNKCC